MPVNVSRRSFLAGVGGLVLGVYLRPHSALGATNTEEGPLQLNAFLAIARNGEITVFLPSSEMGQGINTSLPQLVADELDARWSQVRAEHAPEGKEYRLTLGPGYTKMITGGSNSVRSWGEPMRRAGAAARAMLVCAAAMRWNVDAAECTTSDSTVSHPDGHQAGYGELVEDASRRRAPKHPVLKSREQLKLVGKSLPRKDIRAKVDGSAKFGIDIRIPGMVRACTVACPVFGGRVGSVDDSEARAISGVREVLVFDDFVAVVADTWWPAKLAVAALKISWQEGANADLDSAGISQTLRKGLDLQVKAATGRKQGQAAKLLESADIDVQYEVPYLDHATMEPMNCTVQLSPDRCDIWTGTQAQSDAKEEAVAVTGLKPRQVHVHTTLLGGGYGRRAMSDFVRQAVQIATRVDAPVQLIWTREETFRHGFYRPAFAGRLRARLAGGRLEAVHFRVCGSNILHNIVPKPFHGLPLISHFPMEGLLDTSPYVFDNVLVDGVSADLPVPVGFWRSVGHSHNAFFMESLLDEIAHALGQDPVELRRTLISDEQPRFRAVLDAAVERAGTPEAGRYHGVALHKCFGSICAQVVEVSVGKGGLRIHKLWAAIDCGEVVNPDIVEAQIMGGALHGLSAALGGRLEFARGRVVQSNFHDYPLLKMHQAPEVEVQIVHTPGAPIGGIGELGTPPAAPALCNAIFAATGKRIRTLPIGNVLHGEGA
jgi:isoquinoline 1-oxidoreductase beta subunit